MRSKEEILKEYKSEERKMLELLFDIRDLLVQQNKKMSKRNPKRKSA